MQDGACLIAVWDCYERVPGKQQLSEMFSSGNLIKKNNNKYVDIVQSGEMAGGRTTIYEEVTIFILNYDLKVD